MPKPVLVGFDVRSADRAPVDFGVLAARFTAAPLVVGCVLDHADPDPRHEAPAIGALTAELQADADVRAEVRVLEGHSAAAALHHAAEQLDAGLIVVGSSQRGRVNRVLSGSTAERLMHGAPCPVAVVPRSWQARGRLEVIGVGYADT